MRFIENITVNISIQYNILHYLSLKTQIVIVIIIIYVKSLIIFIIIKKKYPYFI